MNLGSLTSGLNPLSLLGGANPLGGANGAEGSDPLALLSQLFGASSANAGKDQGANCSCSGGGQSGACNCGCSCCQKNADFGF